MCPRRKLTISLVLIASLLLSSVASAQNATAATGDWGALKAVAAGTKLSVKLKSGKSVTGRLTSVSDAALSLTVNDKPLDIKAEDVRKVYRVGGSAAKTGALIGAAVGAGSGAAVGASGDEGFGPTHGQMAAGLAVLGGGAGALIGYAIGRSQRKRVLLYEAP